MCKHALNQSVACLDMQGLIDLLQCFARRPAQHFKKEGEHSWCIQLVGRSHGALPLVHFVWISTFRLRDLLRQLDVPISLIQCGISGKLLGFHLSLIVLRGAGCSVFHQQ